MIFDLQFNDAHTEGVKLEGRRAGHASQSWVFALPLGTAHVKDEATSKMVELDVSEELARKVASETRRSLYQFADYADIDQTPFTWPVRVEHKAEGKRYGGILDAKVAGEGRKRGVYLKVDWKKGTWEDILASEYEFVSIGLAGKYTDEQGKGYSPLITEVSLTDNPRFKRIGSIQDTLQLRLSDKDTPMELTEEQLNELIDKRVAERLAEQPEETPEEEAPEADEADEADEEETDEETPEESEEPSDEDGEGDEDTPDVKLSDVMSALGELAKENKQLRAQVEGISKLNFSETGGGGAQKGADSCGPDAKLEKARKNGLSGVDAVLASVKD